jgi:hypothetical protein
VYFRCTRGRFAAYERAGETFWFRVFKNVEVSTMSSAKPSDKNIARKYQANDFGKYLEKKDPPSLVPSGRARRPKGPVQTKGRRQSGSI